MRGPRAGAALLAPVTLVALALAARLTPAQAPNAALPPFKHSLHRTVECTACHTTQGRSHGQLTVAGLRDCQACHHAPEQRLACDGCHARAEIAGRYDVPAQLRMTVWKEPRARTLAFRHALHPNVACATCHTAAVTRAPEKTCASCHARHHEPARDCKSCHAATTKALHQRTVHLGCATSGCHADPAVASLPPQRNVCLTCHQDKVTHKQGRECGPCHQVTWTARAP